MKAPGSVLSRARRRRARRGATLFVVTLVMALLTGMGIFASRAAGLAEQSTGYERLNEQTHYLLQHGVALTLGQVGAAPEIYGNPSALTATCSSGQWVGAAVTAEGGTVSNARCAAFPMRQLNEQMLLKQVVKVNATEQAIGNELHPEANAPGTLGPAFLLPQMLVEMSDLMQVGRPPAGSQVAGGSIQPARFVQATFTGWAQIGPYTTSTTCDALTQQLAISTSRETGRSYAILGPL